MKKVIFFVFVICSIKMTVAQSPGYFNYQTVIRDGNGELISNQEVSFRISIIAGSATSDPIYTENHAVQTNEFGVCNLKIGNGTNPTANFNLIDWSVGNYYLKTELDKDDGSGFYNLGTIQLLSVPFSMHSNTASLAKVIDNDVLYFSDSDTLFAVRDREGNIVFAVFPDGAELYVNETVKGKVGGFAISGRSPNKGIDEDYFVVTADSTRVYVNQDQTKGKVGGFAISGRSPNKETISNFMDLTPENYFIGHGSGTNNTLGLYNSFLGYEAGLKNTEGEKNVFIGYISGKQNTTGDLNTFVGDETGTNNTSGYKNVFLGSYSGFSNTEGFANVFLGTTAGPYNTTGNRNIFIGQASGWNNDTADYNIFIGNQSGVSNRGGEFNVFLGTNSGHENYVGDHNVYIGEQTGYSNIFGSENTYIGHNAGNQGDNGNNNVFLGSHSGYMNTGDNNVFIGYNAGYSETGSNKLYISNSETTTPLIGGDFTTNTLNINNIVNLGSITDYPTSPQEGDIIRLKDHTTDQDGLYIYNGSTWETIISWP